VVTQLISFKEVLLLPNPAWYCWHPNVQLHHPSTTSPLQPPQSQPLKNPLTAQSYLGGDALGSHLCPHGITCLIFSGSIFVVPINPGATPLVLTHHATGTQITAGPSKTCRLEHTNGQTTKLFCLLLSRINHKQWMHLIMHLPSGYLPPSQTYTFLLHS
jgi:hypothetical protein